MAARLNRRQAEHTRNAIQTGLLLNRLADHAFNGVELSPTQIRAIEILLKKTLPDLQSIEHTGEVVFSDARQLSREDLQYIAAGGSPRAIEAPRCDGELAQVYGVHHGAVEARTNSPDDMRAA